MLKPLFVSAPFVFRVYFDGGGYWDYAYGSFEIEFNGFKVRRHRISFAACQSEIKPMSNNTAEYLALISALKWLGKVKDKKQYGIEIYGDSQLVVQQVRGTCRCHKPHLARLAGIT